MSTQTTGINGSTTLSTSGTTYTPSSTTSGGTGSAQAMGENDFLQLMMDQLQNQDPLDPSDPTQYMSELAQFSSLEQENNIATNTQQSASQQQTASALSLLGANVTYINSSGQQETGTVSKVDMSSTSGPTLTVGSVSGISLSSISEAS